MKTYTGTHQDLCLQPRHVRRRPAYLFSQYLCTRRKTFGLSQVTAVVDWTPPWLGRRMALAGYTSMCDPTSHSTPTCPRKPGVWVSPQLHVVVAPPLVPHPLPRFSRARVIGWALAMLTCGSYTKSACEVRHNHDLGCLLVSRSRCRFKRDQRDSQVYTMK